MRIQSPGFGSATHWFCDVHLVGSSLCSSGFSSNKCNYKIVSKKKKQDKVLAATSMIGKILLGIRILMVSYVCYLKSVWAAVTKHHSVLYITETYFSQIWKVEVQGQGTGRFGVSCRGQLSGLELAVFSLCLHRAQGPGEHYYLFSSS